MERKEEIKQEIKKLQNELNAIEKDEREIANIKYHLDNKHCISCANRDKKADFFIPECIICLHPSNQEGKDKFKYYCDTCKYWKYENDD